MPHNSWAGKSQFITYLEKVVSAGTSPYNDCLCKALIVRLEEAANPLLEMQYVVV